MTNQENRPGGGGQGGGMGNPDRQGGGDKDGGGQGGGMGNPDRQGGGGQGA